MKFFLPFADMPADAERNYDSIRKFVEANSWAMTDIATMKFDIVITVATLWLVWERTIPLSTLRSSQSSERPTAVGHF